MSEPHPTVLAVHHAARAVARHGVARPPVPFWRRLFVKNDPSLYDEVRHFAHVLHSLLDLPPTMLSQADIAAVGTEVDEVVQRAEQAIERNDRTTGEPLEALAPVIYKIRDLYEQIYRRGAAGGA
jgi:hypothetical protein